MSTIPLDPRPPTDPIAGIGRSFALGTIEEPGAYLCNWSGHLLLVPEEATPFGQIPHLEIRAREVLYVTKLSDDPFIPLATARIVATDLGHVVNF